MKRLSFDAILLAAMMLPCASYADVLSPEAALGRAVMQTRGENSDYTLAKTFKATDGQPAMYLFRDKGGSLVVSADDNAQPLLAILDNESDGTDSNPTFDYWMAEYARQIEWVRNNPARVAGPAKAAVSRPSISPLLKTTWDQGAPYNYLAPEKDGVGCFTGCVATAITQVMNYHQWPEKGSGSNSYVTGTNKFNMSCNFDDVVFDWANMANSYNGNTTDDQDFAVADLMYTVGVALNMDYGVSSQGGSGAYTENVPYALVKYFNYDKGAHVVYRDAMRYADWEQLVYDQLSLGPVYYAGSSDDGAHAYVCDGYKDGYFHINWGWGGSQDGYYLLTAMFPGSQQGAGGSTGSYDFEQMIVADIKKPQPDSEVKPLMIYMWGHWLEQNNQRVETMTVNRTAQFSITGWAQNRSIEPLNISAGLQLESENGEVVTVLDAGNHNLERYNPYFNNQDCNIYNLTTKVTSSVKNGKYVARPVFKVKGSEEWEQMKILKGYHQAYLLDVSDNHVTISKTEQADVYIDHMEFSGRTVANKSVKINITMTNDSEYDYESCIRMFVYDINDNDKQISRGGRRFVSIPAGETLDFAYESNFMDDIKPGKYMVWISDVFTNEWLGNGIQLELEKAPEAPTLNVQQFYFNGDSNNADNMNLDFTMMVKCIKGWFRDKIDVTIWTAPENGAAGYYAATATCDEFELDEGKQAKVNFHTEIPDPELGMRYIAGAWYGGNQISNPVYFKILKSGIEIIEESEPVSVEVYNLSGVKMNVTDMTELPSGIYVVRTTDASGNVSVTKRKVK